MKFTFIRHGQTDWNRDKRLLGWEDMDLNEAGLEQARTLLQNLKREFDVIYSSPLRRAMQTAGIINQVLGLPIEMRDELKERHFGSLSGKTWEEMKPGISEIDMRQKYDYQPFGGESAEQVKDRLFKFIEDARGTGYKQPLVITHGGIIRMLYFFHHGRENPDIKNTSIHEFDL